MIEYKGIDVSKWQGNIDWGKVKKAGIDFAMIRAGYGKEKTQIDKNFKNNVVGAKAVGIDIGVYWYSYAKSVNDAKKEAQVCLSAIKGLELGYPVVFDIEDKSMQGLGKNVLTGICEAFCDTLEEAGYYAMIYTNPNWLKNYLNASVLLDKYDLWLAQWKVEKPSYNCGLWQYTDCGKVDGINGSVDMNIAYRYYPQIMKNKGLNGYNKKTIDTSSYFYYTVQKGDTLWDLSNKYLGSGNKYTKIMTLNNLNSTTLLIGQKLKIPNLK